MTHTRQPKELNFKKFIPTLFLKITLEFVELLLRAGRFGNLEDVEANGLAQWSALAHGHHVAAGHITVGNEKNGGN